MKVSTDSQARYISIGLFVALCVFAVGYSLWSNRHGAAANRLSELRESANRKASRTADAMRGLKLHLSPRAEEGKSTLRANNTLQGRCLIVDLTMVPGNSDAGVDLEFMPKAGTREVSPYQAWLAEAWRAETPEQVSFVIWLQIPHREFGPDIIYLRGGKVVGTSGSTWDENYRAKCQVTVTDRSGRRLKEFEIAAQARNGKIQDLRSFEASTMREIAKGIEMEIWSPEVLAQFESPRYVRSQ